MSKRRFQESMGEGEAIRDSTQSADLKNDEIVRQREGVRGEVGEILPKRVDGGEPAREDGNEDQVSHEAEQPEESVVPHRSKEWPELKGVMEEMGQQFADLSAVVVGEVERMQDVNKPA